MKPRSPLRWSLRAKVFVVVLTICVGLVTALTVFFGRASILASEGALADKALNYGKLAGKQLEPALAFDDHDAAREVFNALKVDSDVAGVGLFGEGGRIVERDGEVAPPTGAASIERSATHIRVGVPVVAPQGAKGMVVVEMSVRDVQNKRRAAKRTAAAVLSIGVLIAFLVAWASGRYLTHRLGGLARNASSVARGELDALERLDSSSDEIGDLSAAFGAMTTNLKKLIGENERRTQEIAARNTQMRTVLDHVAQGFFTIDDQGRIGPQRSAIVERWFGELPGDLTITELLRRADDEVALWFELGWQEVVCGVLPPEVSIEQLPKTLHFDGRILQIEVTPISGGSKLTALVVLTDVTEARERERTNAARAEVLAVLERALEDKSGLMEFIDEGSGLVDGVVKARFATLGEVKRAVHTLKGNCSLFGLSTVATFCHELETRMAELNDMPSPSDRKDLAGIWAGATSSLVKVFARAKDTLEVARVDLDDLVASVSGGAARSEIGRRARLLRLEPMSQRLARMGESASALAHRLQKDVDVEVDGGNVRFDSTAWAPFWAAFAHVVRNAVDHGIEEGGVREARGKSRAGKIRFEARVEQASFVLRVTDDGGGVNWQAIAAKAARNGVPHATQDELEAALFVDGLSSKDEVTDMSGRGIGLGAVRVACRALYGHIRVESVLEQGTTFSFIFPVEALGDAYTRIVSTNHVSSVA